MMRLRSGVRALALGLDGDAGSHVKAAHRDALDPRAGDARRADWRLFRHQLAQLDEPRLEVLDTVGGRTRRRHIRAVRELRAGSPMMLVVHEIVPKPYIPGWRLSLGVINPFAGGEVLLRRWIDSVIADRLGGRDVPGL